MLCIPRFSCLSIQECHAILPSERTSTPLTEPDVRISLIRLFHRTHETGDRVTIFFHGHDHFFAKQELDGVIYQLVPQPSHHNFRKANQAEAYGYLSGQILPNSGHLRVTVCSSDVTVDYVRAYLPGTESADRINGQVSYTYRLERHTGPDASR
jgi:hypothetical protein